MFEDSPEPFDPKDNLVKPAEGDVLILKNIPEVQTSELDRRVVVHCVWDTLAESWDPFGEHAWTQHELNQQYGSRGHWYALVYVPGDEGETWSVASWEVEKNATR
jgi:hypothetical protein